MKVTFVCILSHHKFCFYTHRKPKNQRVKRALEKRAPKLIENTKTALFIRGGHTSETVSHVLKDFVSLYSLVIV